jgi:Tfp pilus assembly major pilin PilA
MHIFALLPLIAGIAYALPQDNCETTTVQVIESTTTATYTSTAVVTINAKTAQNLGTFTLVSTIKSTKTHFTLTTSTTECQSTATA